LVVSVGAECYVALAKGGLTPDHVLVVPLGHFPSTRALPAEAAAELERYKDALRRAYAAAGKATVAFEVCTRSPHAHVQVIPVPQAQAAAVGPLLRTQAAKVGAPLHTPTADEGDAGAPFFRAEVPDEAGTGTVVLYHAIAPSDRFPIQLGRHTLAQLLAMPERADWKACAKPTEAEKADAAAFRKFFAPFDFSLTDA
jgi:diadenosine tetraphosphate (Ap4A) HIT family hydrolase